MLATDTPAELVKARGAATLEDAFIGYLEEATGSRAPVIDGFRSSRLPSSIGSGLRRRRRAAFSLQRLFAYTIRETLELLRDPIRLGFSLLGTTLLMLVFGFGVSTDVNNLSFAVLDRDQSPESRAYLEELRGSTYFVEKAPLSTLCRARQAPQERGHLGCDRNPARFRQRYQARTACLGQRPGSMARCRSGPRPSAAISRACINCISRDPAVKTAEPAAAPPADIEIRFKYNQDFDSIYAMVPSNMAMLLALFPAILMALAIVREKELGSITNLYVTPVTRLEFLVGKQLPYIARGDGQFHLDVAAGAVRLQGSAEGKLSDTVAGSADLCHHDDRLRHADFGVHAAPRSPHCSAPPS